jgi:cobalt/nickel transport system permease protein
MHVPDGFLDLPVALGTAAIAVAGIAVAVPRVERTLPPRRVPLLGLAAAFVFAAQLVNFPVGGGTSGHLVGGVLVTALLGPAAAVVVMTAVLLTQCLLFADGGLTALGANVLNMAILAPLAGSAGLWLGQRALPGPRGLVAGAAFGGWLGVVVAAAACAGQLALAGAASWPVAFPAMVATHLVIGAGEGAITALVLVALWRARPDLLAPAAAAPERRLPLPLLGVGAVGLALCLSPFASELPDGLEHTADLLGLAPAAAAGVAAPLPDYRWPGLSTAVTATLLAGALGTAVACALSLCLGRVLVARQPEA